MYCKYCGKKIKEEDKFCIYCGKPVERVEPVKKEIKEKAGKAGKTGKIIYFLVAAVVCIGIVCVAFEPFGKSKIEGVKETKNSPKQETNGMKSEQQLIRVQNAENELDRKSVV